MVKNKCALCGKKIKKGSGYTLKIALVSDGDFPQIRPEDLRVDWEKLIREEIAKIKKISEKALMDEVAKWWEFRLCRKCAASYRKNPLSAAKLKYQKPARGK